MNLLEDPDGAPYPEAVQQLRASIHAHAHPDAYLPEAWDEMIAAACESIASALTERQDDPAAAWDAGMKAGKDHERSMWQWQAGSTSRLVNGLSERPVQPTNPYLTR